MARILLVDEEANFRRTVAVALRLEGHRVGEASGPAEAKALLQKEEWDLVLVDLLLQGGRGLECARTLAGLLPDRPLLLSSIHPELFERAHQVLPQAMELPKPYSARALLGVALPLLGLL